MHVQTGEMHAAIHAFAWESTPLGPRARWPAALRTMVDLMLGSGFPMFLVWGPQRTLIYNDAYAPILGRRHPDALGRPCELVWPEAWSDFEPLLARAMGGIATRFDNMEVEIHRSGYPERAWFTFSFSGIPGDGDAAGGAFCVCHETSATVLAERQRRGQADMLRQMFERAPGFMALLRGPNHVYEMANAAHREFHGNRNIIGHALADVFPEAVEQGFVALLDQVRATAVPYVGKCIRYVTRRGGGAPEEHYVDFVFQPIVDEDGRPLGIFVQGHEVTAQFRARQALLDADKQKDQFIATLAHELRNPLAPILAAARVLDTPDLPRDRIARSTGVIVRQVEQMAHLLDDLLDMARITRGQVQLQKTVVNADELVGLAVETVNPLLQQRGHKLRVVHRDGAIELEADHVRIVQVVSNLLSNACKYTDRGGEIAVETRLDGEECEISVRDSGIGLPPESLDKVFRMFSQEQTALERSEGGLGIGLALVKGFVELHGGQVSARSEGLGQGCTFTVRLPHARSAAFQLSAQSPEPEFRSSRRSILLADDNRDLVEMLSQFLEMQGHDVVKARDGEEALALARTVRPDVAIVDIGMPRLNGYELAQRIRQEPWGADMLLVAATGWGQDDDKGKATSCGFNRHLTKPFGLDTLEAILR
ncbi:MAG: ATP-binding protein [Telluria sp.]